MNAARYTTLPLIACIGLSAIGQTPLARYNFNGNALDLSGHGYDAVVHATSMPYGSGFYGGDDLALHLTGGAYVGLPELAAPFRQSLGAMTLTFFLFVDGEADLPISDQVILSLGGPGESTASNQFTIRFRNDRLQLATETSDPGPDHFVTLDTTLRAGSWYFIALSTDGDQLTYYRNAQRIMRVTYTPTETTSSSLSLGVLFPGTSDACCYLTGSLDDLRVYDQVLSDEQVADVPLMPLSTDALEGLVTALGPNPADATVDLALDRNGTALDVMDANGRIVFRQAALPLRTRLDVSAWPAGVYLLRLRTSAGVRTERLVVHH
ncbi:MAG TPA: LamG-like jellyroll fold domain-containing protein [Flavobacteriales bacterium]|jgi:hypothetical protein|nr:LamG-like jellyroll fold domain-containing protein [Flavobacteriales bacterium]